MKRFILYNPLAGNNKGDNSAKTLENILKGCELIYVDMTEIKDYKILFSQISENDEIYICGGDGTLNRFINGTEGVSYKNRVFYYAAGSGNDFMNDLNMKSCSKPISLNEYIKELPTVTVNGKTHRFFNGVGLGVDGYVCSEISRKKREKNKQVGYIPVALKALCRDYIPSKATVTVDGETNTYNRVWLTTVMKGCFIGGGMKIAPDQERFDSDGLLTCLVGHNLSKLKILYLFLLIFKGKHTKYAKHVAIKKCKEVKVEFDRPTFLQIDGETIPDVTSYTVTAKTKEAVLL